MINFIDSDPQKLLKEAVERYEASSGETLYPGDEHYMFLSQMLQLIVACKEDINFAANQNLLKYCNGTVLDEYGAQYDVKRLPAQTASANIKFSVTDALSFSVEVPAKTRVTPDGKLVFYLKDDIVIPPGEIFGNGIIIAEQPGAYYNGFLPGQIKSLIDPVDYISSVINISTSTGGSDEEDDYRYRNRIRDSWESISTAGSKYSYEYWAKTASNDIADVEAVKTAAGEVTIYVLMKNALLPSKSILDAVSVVCSSEKHRPLTDKVTVSPAQIKEYYINLTYYVDRGRTTEVPSIQNNVNVAINNFIDKQKNKLGGNLNPDSLRSSLLNSGVYRIDITSPKFLELSPQEVAVAKNVTVNYGGIL